MNLIVCDQGCRYQQEGYCTLNHISSLTSDLGAKCGYYVHRDKQDAVTKSATPVLENTSAPYYADRL